MAQKKRFEPDVIRTRNLLIWSQTRYRCATSSDTHSCCNIVFLKQTTMLLTSRLAVVRPHRTSISSCRTKLPEGGLQFCQSTPWEPHRLMHIKAIDLLVRHIWQMITQQGPNLLHDFMGLLLKSLFGYGVVTFREIANTE